MGCGGATPLKSEGQGTSLQPNLSPTLEAIMEEKNHREREQGSFAVEELYNGCPYGNNPLQYLCEECELFKDCWNRWLKFDVRIPRFVVRQFFPILKPNELRLLMYLKDQAKFDRKHPNYCTYKATYDDLEKATGVSANHMGKHFKRLVKMGLITHKQTRIEKPDGTFATLNVFTILWMKRLDQLQRLSRKS